MKFPPSSTPTAPASGQQRPSPTGLLSTPFGNFVLTNLEGEGSIIFERFPGNIGTEARANWQGQDTNVGMKPLFYANREPRQIKIEDLLLDKTDINASITPDIEALFKLMDEIPNKGRPPVLLATWGDRKERCILESASINEVFCMGDGTPMRARVTLTLVQFQDEPNPNGFTRPRRVNNADFSRPRRASTDFSRPRRVP
jgi:hypothetical protein